MVCITLPVSAHLSRLSARRALSSTLDAKRAVGPQFVVIPPLTIPTGWIYVAVTPHGGL